MLQQQIIYCQKHKKKQKNILQLPSNCYICMNRYCPHAYNILCNTCKIQHRDHQVKLLSIQDISFLLDRLLKMPFKQAGTFIIESVDILKKFTLVSQFANKIKGILRELQQQTLQFIGLTENIISQYAQCKNAALQISQSLELQTKQSFEYFTTHMIHKLHKIDYNIQKDRLQYGSLQIKQKQDNRRKNLTFLKRKIQQVKEYSMKIIQVILNNDQSDQQEEDILYKKKMYDNLKMQINNLVNYQVEKKQVEQNMKQEQKIQYTPVKQIKQEEQKQGQKIIETIQTQIQTDNGWIQQMQNTIRQLKRQLQVSNLYQKRLQSQHRTKLISLQRQRQSLVKQKQNHKKQRQKAQKNYEQKCQMFSYFEHRLRDNFYKRNARYKERQQLIKQLAQLVEIQRIQHRSRDTGQKQNRSNSKSRSKNKQN